MKLSGNGFIWIIVLGCLWPDPAWCEPVHVAVAANFKRTLQHIVTLFEKESGHHVVISSGSTGKLYAQIKHGAPFHLFLSADQSYPKRLEQEGYTVAGSRFSYAQGRLVFWSPLPHASGISLESLKAKKYGRLALANPEVAPYGRAAQEVLQFLGVWAAYAGRMAFGENVGQTMAFVASGNVDAGFVALAQVLEWKNPPLPEEIWEIPQNMYQPLYQDAVLLIPGRQNQGALALSQFLRSPAIMAALPQWGYGQP